MTKSKYHFYNKQTKTYYLYSMTFLCFVFLLIFNINKSYASQQSQPTSSVSEAPTPQFSDYPAQKTHHGKNAPVKLVSEFDRNFRTRIRDTENMEANFAGNHVISTWGCGTMCTMGVAVNTQTGDVTGLPGTICCWWGEGENIIFRPNSRLLILAGRINEGDVYGAHFYEFLDNQFVHIKTTVLPEND
ncbi:hypothetical protein RP300_00824 [Oligella urethralis]|jgi:hypothetical protein|uniref:hypothetical protein n=1 Tax=Oligella urethralis TaxID=90245 RepID=UPI000C9C4588|nr:hypothetical protein [Oligella urethralis]PMC16231.1 hypothetical protein CJ230_10220 [Oligella urethralis]WOS37277.1 hypothetical protein RP300_00824 [Oligella urethralis]